MQPENVFISNSVCQRKRTGSDWCFLSGLTSRNDFRFVIKIHPLGPLRCVESTTDRDRVRELRRVMKFEGLNKSGIPYQFHPTPCFFVGATIL